MNILCKWFGHRPHFGYGHKEYEGYFRLEYYTTDGMGIVHARVMTYCERCRVNYQAGYTHVPTHEALLDRRREIAVKRAMEVLDQL